MEQKVTMEIEEVPISKKLAKWLRSLDKIDLLYTALIYFTNFGFGLCVNIYGATLVDLTEVYRSELSVTSQLVTANQIGYMLGTLAGWTYGALSRQLICAAMIFILGLTTFLSPFFNVMWMAFAGLAINGVAQGVYGSAVQQWLIDFWPVRGTALILQVGQFVYGTGLISSSQLASRYVYGDANFTSDGVEVTYDMRRNNMILVYAICGIIQALPAIPFAILFFTNRRVDTQATKKNATGSDAKSDFNNNDLEIQSKPEVLLTIVQQVNPKEISFRKIKLALCGVCLGAYFTGETGYFPYSTSMLQYMEINFSASEAANVTTVLSLFYTIGPLITALISLKLEIDEILCGHYAIILSGIAVVYIGQLNRTMLYIGTAIIGYGFSAMIPGIYAFSHKHFILGDKATSMFAFIAGSLSVVIPIVISKYLETFPLMLVYLLAAFIVLSLSAFATVKIWVLCSNRRRGRANTVRSIRSFSM